MKYALIAPPTESLRLLAVYGLTYHMALAQYVLNDERYQKVYKMMHDLDHFIILDNGAAENGVPLDIKDIVKAANLVGADEVVMPDVLDDIDGTLSRTHAALPYIPARYRAMVPQGKNWGQWTECLREMINMGCATICIAKRYEALSGGRAEALSIIMKNYWAWNHHIHLLGCYRRPLYEIRSALKMYPQVRGIDTAAPVSFAQHDDTIGDDTIWHSLDWDASMEYDRACDNVKLILKECHNARNITEPGY